MDLYTKNGRLLQVSAEIVYSRFETVVGRIRGEKVYGTDGRYVRTITGGRLVYRSTDTGERQFTLLVGKPSWVGTSRSCRVSCLGRRAENPGLKRHRTTLTKSRTAA